jgi:hypothetical protein
MFNLEDYEPVEVRLEKFWKEYPDGRVHTQLLESSQHRFIVFSAVYRTFADEHPWATGLASETISERGMLSTSALEVCETSSLGRALANAGYATKAKGSNGKRPSREEMMSVAKEEQHRTKPFAEKLAEKITVPKEDDPWTIKTVSEAPAAQDAVQLVKDVLGGKTQEDIPSCKHGDMIWKHGVSQKNKKPWGQFRCVLQNSAGAVQEAFCEPIWYMISDDGSWKPQVKW